VGVEEIVNEHHRRHWLVELTTRSFTSLLSLLSLLWRRVPSPRVVVFRFERRIPLQRSLGFLCTRRSRRMRTILNVVVLGSRRSMLS
jgi:hypothetical protein